MTTIIKVLDNQSDTAVAFLNLHGKASPNTCQATGFLPKSQAKQDLSIGTQQDGQLLLTIEGAFHLWDDTNWNIQCMKVGGHPYTLLHVKKVNFGSPNIALTVLSDGSLQAIQIN